jgi:hypothetical protein
VTPRAKSKASRGAAKRRQSPRRSQTAAVAKSQPTDRVATVRLMAKAVLWAVFFAGLFTLHAHVVMQTAALRAESSRLQRDVQELINARGPLAKELWEAQESGRLQAIAQEELGMVTVLSRDRLRVGAETRREVEEAAMMWHWPAGETPQAEEKRPLIEILAGLWTGPDTAG